MEGEGKAVRKRDGRDKGWMKPFERLRTETNGEKWLPDYP